MMNPKRHPHVLLQKVAEETLAFNPERNECALLPEMAGQVLACCDGETPPQEIARSLAISEELVQENLTQLKESSLISWVPKLLSRRAAVGLAAGFMTLSVLRPAAAGSPSCSGGGVCFNGPLISHSDVCDCFGLAGIQNTCWEVHQGSDCSSPLFELDTVVICATGTSSFDSACIRSGFC